MAALSAALVGSMAAQARPSAAQAEGFAWMDGTFELSAGEKLTFSNGQYADLDEEGHCNVCHTIEALTFADVDGDGDDEALIVMSTNVGGAGTSLDGYVFSLESGRPVLRAAIQGGDRGEGGIASLTFEKQRLVVRRFRLSATDGVCCPSLIEVRRMRWRDGEPHEVGPATLVRRTPTPWFKFRRKPVPQKALPRHRRQSR